MRGQDRVAQATQERQERQKQFDQGSKARTWIDEGKAKVFRFCEQGPDIHNFAVHPHQMRGKNGKTFTRNFTCLNDKEDGTACPGCEAGADRKIRGVYNVIERDRPVLRTGADGKAVRDSSGSFIVDGYQDAVVVWDVGSITAETIRQMDGDYNGLMSRDFKVSRTGGSSFQPYVFTPADVDAGAVPLSDADQELVRGKHNLDEVWAPPAFAEGARLIAQSQLLQGQGGGQQSAPPQGGGGQPQQEQPAQGINPYLQGAEGRQ